MTYRLLTATLMAHAMGHAIWAQGTKVDLRTQTRNVDFSGAVSTKTSKTGTVLPATCSTGETFFKTDAPAGQNLYGCKPDNTWTLQSGSSLPSTDGAAGKVLTYDGTAAQWSALSGDVAGTPASVSVRGLQGRPLSNTAPNNGEVLTWNDSASQWQPQSIQIQAGTGIHTAANTISVEDAIVPFYYTGSGAPALSCTAGRDYYVDIANLDLYFCRAPNTWQAVAKAGHQHAASDITSGVLGLARGGTNQSVWQPGTCVQVNSSGTGLESAAGACNSNNLQAGTGINLAGNTISVKDTLVPFYYTGSGAPALSCTAGRDYYVDIANLDLYFCRAPNTWQAVAKAGHQHAASDITSGVLGLARGGTNQSVWQPGTCVQVNSSGTGLESAAGACNSNNLQAGTGINLAGNTISVKDTLVPFYYTGSGAPALSCTAGRDYYVDIANLDLYFCRAPNTWQAVAKAGHQHAASDITSGVLGLARGGTNQSVWQPGTCVQVNSSGTGLESAAGACNSTSGASLPARSGLGYFFPLGAGQEATASSYNLTANKIAFFQFVSAPVSVNRLVYEAGTALTGGTSWNFAIYRSDCSTLVTSGSYSGTAAGGAYASVPLSPTASLGLDVYYLMIAYPSSGSPTIYAWNSSADIAKMGNTGSTIRTGISPVLFSGSWPASGTNLCTGATSNPVNMPYLMLDYQ